MPYRENVPDRNVGVGADPTLTLLHRPPIHTLRNVVAGSSPHEATNRNVNRRVASAVPRPDPLQLDPIGAPPTRPALRNAAWTERPYDKLADGRLFGLHGRIQPGAAAAPQQLQPGFDPGRANTIRVIPEPWDRGLHDPMLSAGEGEG